MGARTCRIAASGYVTTPWPLTTTPMHATQVNVGPQGRHLPDHGRAADDMMAAITWLTGHLDTFG